MYTCQICQEEINCNDSGLLICPICANIAQLLDSNFPFYVIKDTILVSREFRRMFKCNPQLFIDTPFYSNLLNAFLVYLSDFKEFLRGIQRIGVKRYESK